MVDKFLEKLKTKRNKAHKNGKVTPITKIIWRISKSAKNFENAYKKTKKILLCREV